MLLDLLLEFFSGPFLGSSLEQYTLFFATIIGFLLIAKITNFFLDNYVKKLAAKTKSEFDDLLIEAAQRPVFFLAIILGIFFGSTVFLNLPQEFRQTVSNITGLLLIINFAWFLVKIVDGIVAHFILPIAKRTKSRMDDQLTPIISKGLKASIALMALIVILDNFGYDITALVAGLGIGGLAVAFAAQQTIADAFGGLNIFLSKPFFVGDKIMVEGVEGKVEQIGARHTHIRDYDGRLNIISNSKISSAIVKNVTSEPGRKIRMNLGVTYGTSTEKLKKAMELVRQILEGKQKVDKKDLIVGFTEYKESSLNIFVMYYIRETEYADIIKAQNEINLEIKEAFEKNKIEFAYPTQTVYLAK